MTDLQRLIAEQWERGDDPPLECTCGTSKHPPPCPIGAEMFENWKADRDADECAEEHVCDDDCRSYGCKHRNDDYLYGTDDCPTLAAGHPDCPF